jgi:cardiolipin synthase
VSDLHVLGGGAEAFGAILGHIASAQKSIEIHAFLWHDDEIGNKLGQAVLDAAERGVRVWIHKDRVAAAYELSGGNNQSFFHKVAKPTEKLQAWVLDRTYGEKRPKITKLPKSERKEAKLERKEAKLERKEAKRQRQNPLVDQILAHPQITVSYEKKRFDHSKIFIFDDKVLILGSMGIGDDHHDDWIDMMVEARGEEYVQRLRQRMSGEVEFDHTRRVDFLLHNQAAHEKKTCPMLNERLDLIGSAKETLVIEMAYLGDVRFTKAMISAVKRGVDVTLVTGRDVNVLQSLGKATLAKLLKDTGAPDNLTIILHPRMVHAKMVVVDDRYCDVGSANFTKLSHGVYDEVNLYVDDKDLAAELSAHALGHREDGEVLKGQISYNKLVSQIERATVAYQSRNGA